LKATTESKGTISTYTTSINDLYRVTNTPVDKPLNLNNPHALFRQLDTLRNPKTNEDYGIDKKTNLIQTVVKLADPKNEYALEVNPDALEIYKKKFDELKILKTDNQQGRKEHLTTYLFTDILKKAHDVLGTDDKFYLYLRLYQLASLRDNFQLKIVESLNKANNEKTNYIVIPPSKTKRVNNKNLVVNPIGMLIFNTYKTDDKYKQLRFEITPEVMTMVRKYIATNSLKTGDYFFGKKLHSTWVKEQLQKLGIDQTGAAINVLRHAVSSQFYVGKKDPTASERLEFATGMGHSPDMNKLYQRQISQL
jgi:hypothetical protein